jgi:hypothetical protein
MIHKLILSFFILLLVGCTNGGLTPQKTIEDLAKNVLAHDLEQSKKYIHHLYWRDLAIDIASRKKTGNSSSYIHYERLTKITCSENQDTATCTVCSIYTDSIERCPKITLIKTYNKWKVHNGIYLLSCCYGM